MGLLGLIEVRILSAGVWMYINVHADDCGSPICSEVNGRTLVSVKVGL